MPRMVRRGFTGIEIVVLVALITGLVTGARLVQNRQLIENQASNGGACFGTTRSECENVPGCTFRDAVRPSCAGTDCTRSGCQRVTGQCDGYAPNECPTGCTITYATCNFVNGVCPGQCTYTAGRAAHCEGSLTIYCASNTSSSSCNASPYGCHWVSATGATCGGNPIPNGCSGQYTTNECTGNYELIPSSCSGAPIPTATSIPNPNACNAPGTFRCSAGNSQVCSSSVWTLIDTCGSRACTNGHCVTIVNTPTPTSTPISIRTPTPTPSRTPTPTPSRTPTPTPSRTPTPSPISPTPSRTPTPTPSRTPTPTPSRTPTPTIITRPPTLTFTADSASVGYNRSTILHWSSTNASSCTASDAWRDIRDPNGGEVTGLLTTNTVYTLTCYGLGGQVSRSLTINVALPPTPTPVCVPGSKSCDTSMGADPREESLCNSTGTGYTYRPCQSGMLCERANIGCEPVPTRAPITTLQTCTPNTTRCPNPLTMQVERCVQNTQGATYWLTSQCDTGFSCLPQVGNSSLGSCQRDQICTPRAVSCSADGRTSRICNETGTGFADPIQCLTTATCVSGRGCRPREGSLGQSCDNTGDCDQGQFCENNIDAPGRSCVHLVCTPGTSPSCNAQGQEVRCNDNGTRQDTLNCRTGYSCLNGVGCRGFRKTEEFCETNLDCNSLFCYSNQCLAGPNDGLDPSLVPTGPANQAKCNDAVDSFCPEGLTTYNENGVAICSYCANDQFCNLVTNRCELSQGGNTPTTLESIVRNSLQTVTSSIRVIFQRIRALF